MTFSRIFTSLAVTFSVVASASALTFSTNFDSSIDGAPVSTFNTADLSFHNAFKAPLQDSDGIDIPGSEQWQIDAASDIDFPVIVSNPLNYGYGSAVSGTLALNVIDQSVLIRFASDVDIQSFSVTLDNSSFGNLIPTSIDFVNGANVALSESIDQTAAGFVVNIGAVSGVRSIVLPTTAFYDNLSITYTTSAIPEPSSYAALAGLAGLGLALGRRRRK